MKVGIFIVIQRHQLSRLVKVWDRRWLHKKQGNHNRKGFQFIYLNISYIRKLSLKKVSRIMYTLSVTTPQIVLKSGQITTHYKINTRIWCQIDKWSTPYKPPPVLISRIFINICIQTHLNSKWNEFMDD